MIGSTRYLRALRFALGGQANAYGFTLVVWGTGALATSELGRPHPGAVFAYLGGAIVSMALIVLLAFGPWRPFQEEQPPRRPYAAVHVVSALGATAAGWGVIHVLGGAVAFFFASFVAVAIYQVLLATEVALALTREGRAGVHRSRR